MDYKIKWQMFCYWFFFLTFTNNTSNGIKFLINKFSVNEVAFLLFMIFFFSFREYVSDAWLCVDCRVINKYYWRGLQYLHRYIGECLHKILKYRGRYLLLLNFEHYSTIDVTSNMLILFTARCRCLIQVKLDS